MKLAVLTYGTEGDTRPLAFLARALIDAGHDPLLLADAATLGTAASLQVPCVPLAPLPEPGALRRALDQAVGPEMRARAAEVGRMMREEDGLATAVDLVERIAAGGRADGASPRR